MFKKDLGKKIELCLSGYERELIEVDDLKISEYSTEKRKGLLYHILIVDQETFKVIKERLDKAKKKV